MEVTIEITQWCPFECHYCSSNASYEGEHLKYEIIKKFLDEHEHEITRINISGGEPLSHPDFFKILMYCKGITTDVWVYTNLLTNIRFNSGVVKEINLEANVCIVPGEEVYIPQHVNKIHLLKLVHQGRAENISEKQIVVSSNFKKNDCIYCNHVVLQADGKIVESPCKKKYECVK